MQNKTRNNDFGLSNKKCKERRNNGFVFRNNKTGYLVEGQQQQCSNFFKYYLLRYYLFECYLLQYFCSNVICSNIICLNTICSNYYLFAQY